MGCLKESVWIDEGGAFAKEEHIQGICAVGAVISDQMGNLRAISNPLPSTRFYGREEKHTASLRNTFQTINHHFNNKGK
ncbi:MULTISPECIES: IclR family transcriptional regulator C-terminal domain-containing protein [unclassified Bacillus (in: firmicutes)]|uniref:IclR family transcriptional regulator C-terminal domain-containing protein n=1 Tax=unclassified Bacillus (in: firmicutes) TaxID=185979 RepID=UPI00211AFF6D|nr:MULTISPECIES: IclR family transcriptional regulator C-terminal domain-containing protein [unclassified Bacillus (in: firmicutes)]